MINSQLKLFSVSHPYEAHGLFIVVTIALAQVKPSVKHECVPFIFMFAPLKRFEIC